MTFVSTTARAVNEPAIRAPCASSISITARSASMRP